MVKACVSVVQVIASEKSLSSDLADIKSLNCYLQDFVCSLECHQILVKIYVLVQGETYTFGLSLRFQVKR